MQDDGTSVMLVDEDKSIVMHIHNLDIGPAPICLFVLLTRHIGFQT